MKISREPLEGMNYSENKPAESGSFSPNDAYNNACALLVSDLGSWELSSVMLGGKLIDKLTPLKYLLSLSQGTDLYTII